ncbi:fructose-2,6-bisphosphatase TIGAR [Trichonephila inaurata madagascariensis]|uniref:Fructose-2,6-bisphosphatase TIGAR n=1 Tax=Trichonephila inaurata madagascariensis TaxID=2747483 RepID=A0A8X6YTE6_9ARAC|nr:fructose-2,6-bisphosphatase TIGAR [Trichonephila inaurata madagascariensis]
MVVFALTLIRHGETAHNKDNVIQGQMDVPLSQTGLHQAELLGIHLQNQQYSHVYASDLTRAMQTAESIIRQNKSYKASLLRDHRLRERKFGAVEGKSFKYLKEAAEKSNQNSGQYTPPGGETIQQVHERAVSFFQDICEMVKERSKELSTDAAIGRMNLNGPLQIENGKQSGQKRKWENGENDGAQNIEVQNGSSNKICIKESAKNENMFSDIMKRDVLCSVCEGKFDSDNGVLNKSSSTSNLTENETSSSIIENKPIETPNENRKLCDTIKTDPNFIQNGCGSSCSKFEVERGQFSVMFTDDDIRSQIMSNCSDLPNIECPNVSLSPLVDQNFITSPVFCNPLQESVRSGLHHERRLSVCSSCDDADSGPTLMANILVVSHGGWLRELFRHFVEDLECSVPGGRKQALRISPNAGLSKFTVSLEEHDGYPKIICLQIHDKQHLVSS